MGFVSKPTSYVMEVTIAEIIPMNPNVMSMNVNLRYSALRSVRICPLDINAVVLRDSNH